MKTTKITAFLLILLSFASCIDEDLDPCPPETGNVKINLYVETFRNKSENPLASRESRFNQRVHYLCYYLYKGDSLIQHAVAENLAPETSPAYVLEWDNLDFGDYTLVAVSNCAAAGVLAGSGDTRADLVLHYPGADLTDDFFTCVFPFRVDCNCTAEWEAGLQRAHGVLRSRFVNLPAHVTAVEVSLDGVSGQKTVCGDYDGDPITVTRRYVVQPVAREGMPGYVLGTFPTQPGRQSVYRVKLYSAGSDTPVFDKEMVPAIQMIRNQLVDITATFANDGTFSFEVDLDTDWDGTVEGGGTVVD